MFWGKDLSIRSRSCPFYLKYNLLNKQILQSFETLARTFFLGLLDIK